MIRVSGIWKRFGRTLALRDVSLEICTGETVAVIGTNGSGKTTLMRILAGLERPTLGSARIGCLDCWRDRETVWKILDFLCLDEQLPSVYSTYESMHLFSPNATVGEIRRRADRVLSSELLNLEQPYREIQGSELSTGMLQKAKLATLDGLPILVIDEPTSGLDPNIRLNFRRFLARQRRTLIIVTHDMLDVEQADRVFILCDGRLRGWGRPDVLKPWLMAASMEEVYARLTMAGPSPLQVAQVTVVPDRSVEPGECATPFAPWIQAGEIAIGRAVLRVRRGELEPPVFVDRLRVSPADAESLGLSGKPARHTICWPVPTG